MTPRAVIYARYSSDNQRESSIEDQLRLCKERIKREDWDLVEVYSDAAVSGATHLRPRYQALLQDARIGSFDIVVAEALDRLSRDLEDVAGLFKRLSFSGIRIVTLAEGDVTDLHVGLKGTMNALFLKDLAQKTHRGLRGRVEAGRSAGGKSYGYDVVRQIAPDGRLVRGQRTINPAEAAVVCRIFRMFAAGASPIAIAKTLNAEGVPGPQGRSWRDTTIRGHAGRGTGLLRNELYVGRLVWNRLSYIKDPASGRRVSRPNPQLQIIANETPEFRVIDQDLWNQVQRRLQAIRSDSGADQPGRRRFWEDRRAHHVLTGKVFCGCCDGLMTNIGRDYLACSAARRQGVCDNRRGIQRQVLEGLVLDALTSRLMQPEHVATFVAEFTAEWNRLQTQTSAATAGKRRELEKVQRKLDGLLDAIAGGLRGAGLQEKIDQLEAQRLELRQVIDKAPRSVPSLHPNLAEIYRKKVEALQQAVAGRDGSAARDALRSLIDRIILHPADARGFEVELVGEIGAMIELAQQTGTSPGSGSGPDVFRSSMKVVAGTGFEPVTFRL